MEIFKKVELHLEIIRPQTLEDKKKVADYFQAQLDEAKKLVPYYEDPSTGHELVKRQERALSYLTRLGSLRITNRRLTPSSRKYHKL
jgi:hypothetical protein